MHNTNKLTRFTTGDTKHPIKTNWLKIGAVCVVAGVVLCLLVERSMMGAYTLPVAGVVAVLTGGQIRRLMDKGV